MTREFLRTMLTPAVLAAQQHYYGKTYKASQPAPAPDELGSDEIEFVQQRDSFYLASVTEDGWPYMQHRGGPRGFLRAVSPRQLVFADYGGNRQLITVGSLQRQPRVCLFLMDYPARTRLKILGTATALDARDVPAEVSASAPPTGHAATPERIVRIDVQAFDWNCPKFITPRFTADEVETAVARLQARIRELEAELAQRPS